MAVGGKQKLITEIVGNVLGTPVLTNKTFDWFFNKHQKEHFGKHFSTIGKIFEVLGGDIEINQSKRTQLLKCDAYIGGKYNCIFEFDEFQHFSSARMKTFEYYPIDLNVNFDIEEWKKLCQNHSPKSDKYRARKVTVDFDFVGGRTAQRAYLDCFRDLLPEINGLQPTLRINEFEVVGIERDSPEARKIIEKILKTKL